MSESLQRRHGPSASPTTAPKIASNGTDVDFAPGTDRQVWSGRYLSLEILRIAKRSRVDFSFRSTEDLLSVWCQGRVMYAQTDVDGISLSSSGDLGRRINFIPAGSAYSEALIPLDDISIVNFYIRPGAFGAEPALRASLAALGPHLHIADASLWSTASKLAALATAPDEDDGRRGNLLSLALIEELARACRIEADEPGAGKGGLAPWQITSLVDYIEKNIQSTITVRELAELLRISDSHLSRSFKRTFGIPPHRYILLRRLVISGVPDRQSLLLPRAAGPIPTEIQVRAS